MSKISIKIEYLKAANYSLIHNRIPVCQSLEVTNGSDEPIYNLLLTCSGEMMRECSAPVIACVPAHESVRVTQLDIVPDVEKLVALNERTATSFKLTAKSGDECLFEKDYDIDLMAYDQWLGSTILPQTIASFVTPNSPCISGIVTRAAQILKEMTGSSSFVGYQSGNTNDVRAQVGAIFAAIHEIGIVYRTLPAGFEEVGQRVTLPEKVIDGKLANCLEMTNLFASVLESVGINSGIVFQEGHAYLAAWLVDDSYPYSICDDASFLEKKCSRGIDEMMVLECTVSTNEKASFDSAIQVGEKNLASGKFQMFIDIRRCRLERIFPLPGRVEDKGKWVIVNEGVEHDQCVVEVKEHDRYDLSNIGESKRELTKLDIWERKLLDFSLRNSLLNLSLRRRAVQLVSFEVGEIEDHLSDGDEFCILPKPSVEFKLDTDDKLVRSKLAESLRDLAVEDMKHHNLHTYQTEGETKTVLKNIYRAARNAIEETGANSLFLSIGALRWYETEVSDSPRYAPIILLPVEMVYKKGNYYVRARDEEAMLNVTLIEFLRQNFDIKINGIDPLPKDEHGIDVPLVFALLRDALKDQKRWDVEEECLLGTFSFSKFLMWNDVHNHRKELLSNKIVESLVENRLTYTPDPVVRELKDFDSTVPPSDVALPVAVDSSQMSAVLEGGKGHSFILYGPPGTGKSQTITNLIANALFQGKRVLFVAEKMAALSVVESRLAKIGLEPFCLEMHSNKVAKRHILEQLGKALNVAHIKSPAEYADIAKKLFAQRKELIEYMKALHKKEEVDGLSLYDCVVKYEAVDALPLEGFESNDRLDATLKKEGMRAVEEVLGNKLDTIIKLVGQPSESELRGLIIDENYAKDNVVEKLQKAKDIIINTQKQLDKLCELPSLREALLKDNKETILEQDGKVLYDEWRSIKAKWFLTRFFAKRKYMDKLRAFNQYITDNDVDAMLDKLVKYTALHKSNDMLRNAVLVALHKKLPVDEVPSEEMLSLAVENLTRWIEHKDLMRDWLHWCNYMKELKSLGLDSVVKALEKRAYTPEEMSAAFLKALCKDKAVRKMTKVPMLTTFEGMLFDDKVKAYRSMADEFQILTQKELYARLASRIPRVVDNVDGSSEIGLLNRNISNGGRGMSLRDLMDSIPTLLPRLCPCMLMSPMSVAQYLTLTQEKFDVVIFDEASQMPTSEAVGAIARGKSLIVVGDPKQMPPTSFFSSTNVDEEEAAIDDMESILEDCRTLEIPSLQLNWHYRSRHESLIAFSNNEYYDGSLITFPSVDDQQTKVTYVPVNGFYDKGGKRSNKAEAEAIVAEIVRRLKDPELRKKSIGVISFSVVQQSLIEDILQDTFDADKTLREYAEEMYEPIFIKNLENVQGDERDVILFSIGYGPNKDGVVSMNFGPLNNAGGERRLNVAVSRSRCEMMVFSTLKSSQVDLRRSKAKGVEGLKHFLEYAESQILVKATGATVHRSDSVVAESIANELRARGYSAKTNIGRSQFKVDVAISDIDNPDVYQVGILLDGKNYRDTQTTRDREIVQPSVLSGLKWTVFRVWSVDWFNNKERVIERVIETIESARNDAPAPEKKAMKFDLSNEVLETVKTNAKEYVEYTARKEDRGTGPIGKLVKKIVDVEQPISMMQVCRRICAIREMTRVTPSLQREVEDYSLRCLYSEPDRKGDVLWSDKAASESYPWYRPGTDRDILDIPMIEIENVVMEAIEEQFSIATDSLTLIAAKKLGFTRRGANVDQAFNLAVENLVGKGLVVVNDGRLTMNK